ncbi:MAG TPA: hypothetical protein VN745_07280 [Verrucomicrobiae bacterium]|nr:hypothetical protein [Verrucomicrobiae bacterium]
MRNPLVQYLVGAFILGIGLIILLSSADIAHGLAHFWDKWAGRRARMAQPSTQKIPAASYRARLMIWRILGALIFADGFIWLALATAEVFHILPRSRP